jgi:hypothetical protein
VRSYGQRFRGQLAITLNEACLERLQVIARGKLVYHLRSVIVYCYPLLDHESIQYWLGHGLLYNDPGDGEPKVQKGFQKVVFDGSIFDLPSNGKCEELIGSALAMLPVCRVSVSDKQS